MATLGLSVTGTYINFNCICFAFLNHFPLLLPAFFPAFTPFNAPYSFVSFRLPSSFPSTTSFNKLQPTPPYHLNLSQRQLMLVSESTRISSEH